MDQSVRSDLISASHPDRHPVQRGGVPHHAQMIVGANGEIKHLTKEARRLLGYYPSQRIESNFFQLVHDEHRVRVMWELAEMVGRHRQRATWLVRLKTGIGTWLWLQVGASNQLHQSGLGGIVLTLSPTNKANAPQAQA
jgi:PAS domain S-box-containing protein